MQSRSRPSVQIAEAEVVGNTDLRQCSKACGEQAITLAVWTQMKAVGAPHGDPALCKELAAQVSWMKAGQPTRYLGKARGDDCH